MNVLSLFDGISCARIALEKLGVKVSNYYASEIDVNAIKVSTHNFPDIIQLGDIRNIDATKLPKIDLLIGGSPCQDLSNAQNGLGLEGTKSGLFYEYIRILKEVNPKYFLLENVKNKWGNVMSEYVGVPFIHINSAIYSAQSRPRYYWTNIDYPKFPDNQTNETIKDIIEEDASESFYFKKPEITDFIEKTNLNSKKTQYGIIKLFDLPKEIHKDNERQRRVYSIESKSPTILARADTTKIMINNKIRKLTPLECERLQKIPDNYTSICSNTQRYKMIGNAFTVDVIAHFLKGLDCEPRPKDEFQYIQKDQLSLQL
jgi:site-specific DNA-cytosine methylase